FGLVNNAGIAVAGPLLYIGIDELRQQLEVNLIAQLTVTQAFAPLLGADTSRKFGLEGLSESLRRELMVFGIDVIMIRPGAVATPIWDKADEVDVTRFTNTPYYSSLDKVKEVMIGQGRKGYPPERIGRAVLKALTA